MAKARSVNHKALPAKVAEKRLARTFASMRAVAAAQNDEWDEELLRARKTILQMRRDRK